MDTLYLRSQNASHAEKILHSLSTQQYLHPHQSLRLAVNEAAGDIGFCPGAAENAMNWLHVNPDKNIGRLRHAELVRLADHINRFWQQLKSDALPQRESA